MTAFKSLLSDCSASLVESILLNFAFSSIFSSFLDFCCISSSAFSKLALPREIEQADSKNPEFVDKLANLRTQIDKIDDQIFQKLGERMQIVEKIGEFKRDNDVTILQVSRWDEILQKRTAYGSVLKLEKDFTEKMLELIHSESIRKQTSIMNTKAELS